MKSLYLPLLLVLLFFNTSTAQTFTSVSTFSGSATPGLQNGNLAAARFNGPYGICLDEATGTFYVADALNHCVRKISIDDVGVHDNQQTAVTLEIFPNPSADHITLSIPSGFGLRSVLIYDVRGALCKTITIQNSSEQVIISVAELGSGQYFIVAEGEKSTGKATLIRP